MCGGTVLTDGVKLCIKCTRLSSKLAGQAHKSRYCRHARTQSRGRHTGRREWEGGS